MIENMPHIITNTIRKYIYTDVAFARTLDFLLKHNCYPLGSGVKDGKIYLIFDIDSYMDTMDKFKTKSDIENLREY